MPTPEEVKAELVRLENRQKMALDMRLAGVPFAIIAKKLDYSSEEEVQHDVKSALYFSGNYIRDNKEELRIIEILRLERLHTAIWGAARDGDLRAISQLLRISELHCKLVGIDANTVEQPVIAKGNTTTISSCDIDQWLEMEEKRKAITVNIKRLNG